MAEPGEIEVRGGLGGTMVAVEDLRVAASTLSRCADLLAEAALAIERFEIYELLPTAPSPDVTFAYGALIEQIALATEALRNASTSGTHLHWGTRQAALRYDTAHASADLEIIAARAAHNVVLPIVRRIGEGVGLLEDGTILAPRQRPVPHCSRVEIRDIASLMTSQSLLSGEPIVRVIEVPQANGSSAWIVQIPGTITFDPRPRDILHDLSADVKAMHDDTVGLSRAAIEALTMAQSDSRRYASGDPVLLAGHSLGAIAAMVIASDEETQRLRNITHLFTAGAPVGHFDPVSQVNILSLEHEGDWITEADLVPNPPRRNWTTVHRTVPEHPRVLGVGPAPVHGALMYRETARLAAAAAASGAEPSLREWTQSADAFFGGEHDRFVDPALESLTPGVPRPREPRPQAIVRDYDVRRHQRGVPPPSLESRPPLSSIECD
ncbi:MAG: hypothetical protein Q4G67_02540 [Actinomycetia bacterium]|nr:hypothetical protein [Actinomycetes bacterium]